MEESINILLIEDNPADAKLMDIYLKEAFGTKYSLSVSGDLFGGLKLLAKNTFNVIIIDLSLPDSAGLDTFKNVYKHSPHTPIIVLTGLEDDSVGINAMKMGAQDFLIKGKSRSRGLKRSINYSIQRYKLLKELSDKSQKLEEKTADLLREQQKLSEAQKLAHIGSWEWNIIENIVNYSEELYRIYGLLNNQFKATYDEFLKHVHIEDRKFVKDAIDESLKTLQPFNFYYRVLRPDNSLRILQARGEILTDNLHKPVKVLGVGQDVTERAHEEELQKLVLAATQSFNSVVIADREGKIEWVNEGFTKLTGYTM